MMVARQLHKMSKVPRTFGAETKLCTPSVGMVQLGWPNVEASVDADADAAASRSMQSSISVIVASMLVLSSRS
jgi:hypothetical protein